MTESDPLGTRTPSRPRVLVVAYLCEPGTGSERGAGWGMVDALSGFSDCAVLTNPASAEAIARHARGSSAQAVDIVAVAEPGWTRSIKRGRVGEFLTYLAWQRTARKHVGRVSERFDVAVHATLSAYWLPSLATSWDVPTVWGPVGGAVTTPPSLWRLLGPTGVVIEIVDWLAVRAMSLLPATRRTWRRATVRVAQNQETLNRLPARLRDRTTVMNHALFHRVTPSEPERSSREPYVAWISPMETRKGASLALRAYAAAHVPHRLMLIGDGPQRQRLERLSDDLGIADHVEFVGRVPHRRAIELLSGSDVAIFTGLREEGGLALAEAMSLGVRCVVLRNGGAATVAQASTSTERVSLVEPRSVNGTIAAMAAAITDQVRLTRSDLVSRRKPLLDYSGAIARLEELVRDAVSTRESLN